VLLAQVDSCVKYWLGFADFVTAAFPGRRKDEPAFVCVCVCGMCLFLALSKRALHTHARGLLLLGPGARKMLWRDLLVPGAQLSQAQRGGE
jgi:hypothetical protein